MEAMIESSIELTICQFQPKDCKNHKTADMRAMIVPALFKNLLVSSQRAKAVDLNCGTK